MTSSLFLLIFLQRLINAQRPAGGMNWQLSIVLEFILEMHLVKPKLIMGKREGSAKEDPQRTRDWGRRGDPSTRQAQIKERPLGNPSRGLLEKGTSGLCGRLWVVETNVCEPVQRVAHSKSLTFRALSFFQIKHWLKECCLRARTEQHLLNSWLFLQADLAVGKVSSALAQWTACFILHCWICVTVSVVKISNLRNLSVSQLQFAQARSWMLKHRPCQQCAQQYRRNTRNQLFST